MIEIKKIDSNNLDQCVDAIIFLTTNLDDSDNSFSIAHIEKLVTDNRTYFFIAIDDDKGIGYALAYRFPSLTSFDGLGYLYDIEVLNSHRQKGIGKKLINEVLMHLRKDGVSELWLGTATDNFPAQALFNSTGAERSEEVFHDYTYHL